MNSIYMYQIKSLLLVVLVFQPVISFADSDCNAESLKYSMHLSVLDDFSVNYCLSSSFQVNDKLTPGSLNKIIVSSYLEGNKKRLLQHDLLTTAVYLINEIDLVISGRGNCLLDTESLREIVYDLNKIKIYRDIL